MSVEDIIGFVTWPNGGVKHITYHLGSRENPSIYNTPIHIIHKYWDIYGKLVYLINHVEGTLHGIQEGYINGAKRYYLNYINGWRHGRQKWWRDGKPYNTYYIDGQRKQVSKIKFKSHLLGLKYQLSETFNIDSKSFVNIIIGYLGF